MGNEQGVICEPDTGLADLSEVIGRIYDCALDPGQWPIALDAMRAFIGGNRVRIFLFNANPATPGDGDNFGVDHDFNVAFDNDSETLASIKYGFVVADMDRPVTLPEILGATGGRDVNGRLPYDNRFYREWMQPRGAHDALATLVLKTRQRFGGFAMTRSQPLPPFGQAERDKARLLAPHVRRALTISDLVGRHCAVQAQFSEIVDALATPVVVVDAKGRIEHANVAASRLIEAGVIPTQGGMLASAGPDGGGPPDRTFILGGARGPALIATGLPLTAAKGSGARAIFFHHPQAPAQLPGEAFARLYGLTGTELRIVMYLAEGLDVARIGERLGSAADTVRWHLKNVRAKTGCSRISELALLAARTVLPVRAG